MRLIKLKIKNIASLKDENVINFSQIQNQSPLFAITGETGAGKSSILNSIGLVLYGKVYKSNVTQNDLVTLGEKEGQIELIFQAQGKTYLAFWRAKVRKQNGDLYSTPQTPQRELYTLEGEEFESKRTILTTKTEELLNLDFDQFCKCIILNQGEFARFLSSTFTERKEILEKLYPGEMLESLSRALKAELDSFLRQKEELEIELKTLVGDGPQGEDLTVLRANLEDLCRQHEALLKDLEKIEYHYSTLASYHTKHTDSKLKIEAVKATLSKETSVLNDLLILSQKAGEELLVVQKAQEQKLPRLQELLKSEESLKHVLETQKEAITQNGSLTAQVDGLKLRETQLLERLRTWSEKSEELGKSFLLPLAEIKKHESSFEEIADLFTHRELIRQELGKEEERFGALELQGKEEARELKELQLKKAAFGEESSQLKNLEAERRALQVTIEERQRSSIRSDELTLKLKALAQEEQLLLEKIKLSKEELGALTQEHIPLETTIKLQNLLSAVEVCLTHPSLSEKKSCPVCRTDLSEDLITELRSGLEKTDFSGLKLKEATLGRSILKKEAEVHQLELQRLQLVEELKTKGLEAQHLSQLLAKESPRTEELDQRIIELQKKVWDQEKTLKDEEKSLANLSKTREQYGALKKEILKRTEIQSVQTARLQELTGAMTFLGELKAETIQLLKSESRKYKLQLDLEAQGEKLSQEKEYLTANLLQGQERLAKISSTLKECEERASQLGQTLVAELGERKASELISELSLQIKEKAEALVARDRELKSQELRLKESQSRLYTLDELLKEIDLHFTKELHALKELGQEKLPVTSPELTQLMESLAHLGLELSSPADLFIPLGDLVRSQRSLFKEKTSELKERFGSVKARLEDWEKRQDRISLLLLKSQNLTQNLERRSRLYEVLGKDELRTFVLSLVEENLITQTNDELQKLCQGRYEIIHQSRRMKLTPEFYILDKFREGGLRKVSTLSGGETFMVSLAMALGLAEMTRGKAEIDSLFIDEGFGTLDQESLEDVLDMLKQIQTRGLMVGIISHVKALTSALPVNLLVSKKQDGTSKIGVISTLR